MPILKRLCDEIILIKIDVAKVNWKNTQVLAVGGLFERKNSPQEEGSIILASNDVTAPLLPLQMG